MSLFDILSAVSIGKNVNDPNTKAAKILKKMDSAVLTILNGEALTYTNIGGRTGNTFGVNNNFQFDVEVFLEALFHTDSKNIVKKGFSGLGSFLLGPGSANNVTVGNRTSIDWMPKSVHNFSVIRGGKPYTFLYGNELDDKYGEGFNDTSKFFNIALSVFSAVIFGYDLVFNLGGQFNLKEDGGGLMSPVGDPKYIATKQAEIAANEKKQEELKKISDQQAASGTILSPDALKKQQDDQEHLKDNYEELEESLKKAEKEKEWLIWTNIVIENKGIWVLKMLEYVKGSFVQVANQIKKAKEKIGIADEKIATATASIVANQQALALAIANPAVDQSAIESEIEKLKNLKNTLDGELSLAKKELTAAEDRLTFLKPPA
jgi:hypothetical protein